MEGMPLYLLGATFCGSAIGSYVFVRTYLLSDFEVKSRKTAVLFSLTFGFCVCLLELFLFELSKLTYASDRQIGSEWQLVLYPFTYLMLYILPLVTLAHTTAKFRCGYILWALCCAGYIYALQSCWSHVLFYFFACGEACQASTCFICFHVSPVDQIKLLGIAGVLLSAVLSGFGAVNCIYVFFNFFSEKTSQADFVAMRQLFFKNAHSLVEKKLELLHTHSLVETSKAKESKGLIARFVQFMRPETDKLSEKLQFVKSEVFSLETINQQYCLNLYDVLVTKEQHLLAKSLKGKLYALLARGLVLYAIYRLVFVSAKQSIINVLFKRKYHLDPITRLIQITCMLVEIDQDYAAFVSGQLSFVFVGILIFTNIRSFTNYLIALTRSCSKLMASSLSAESLLLVSAMVMGAYFMATVLLMRANLPVDLRQGLTDALQGVDFFTFHHLFDAAYTVASLVTVLLLYANYLISVKHKEL